MKAAVVLLPVVTAVFLTMAGCAPVSLPADRLEVTEELRTACPYQTDQQIEMALQNVETIRLIGASYADIRAQFLISCGNTPDDQNGGPIACTTCFYALIDQVYGQ